MMNGFNQFICDFCQQACDRLQSKKPNKKGMYQRCSTCQVVFLVSHQGKKLSTAFTRTHQPSNTLINVLINHQENKTSISSLREWKDNGNKTRYTSNPVVELQACPNFTPDNILDKIKTYILFC